MTSLVTDEHVGRANPDFRMFDIPGRSPKRHKRKTKFTRTTEKND